MSENALISSEKPSQSKDRNTIYDESNQIESVESNNPILVFISRLIVYLSCLFFGIIVTMANYQKEGYLNFTNMNENFTLLKLVSRYESR